MLQLKTFSNTTLVAVIASTALFLIMLSAISIYYANRMVSQYSSLVATSIEVKQELAIAHLWFEEIMSGDENESIQTVWLHLGESKRHIDEILEGGNDLLVEVNPVADPEIRKEIDEIKNKLAVFHSITSERYNSKDFAGVGSAIDQKYDAVFNDLLNHVDIVVNKLKLLRKDDLGQFNAIQKVLILLILVFSATVGLLLYFYQNRSIALLNEQQNTIKALNESKTRFQDIAFCGGDWIWEVDTQGRYTYASENVVDIIGYTANEILGHKPFELMSAEESEGISAVFKDIVSKQDRISDLDNWNIHKNGNLVCLRTNGVPVFDSEGELAGYRGVDKDVTEQMEMNQLLMRTQKMDALGKLTGGIAHDFNNMLGVILGYAELLREKVSADKDLVKYVQQIINSGERSRKLTEKLLAFSRKENFSAEETDLNQLLRDDRHMLEKTLTARIDLRYELEVDLWPVCLDKAALEDAILNISINAMHAIADTGTLSITTRNIHLDDDDVSQLNIEAGDYVALSLSDTGSGMDAATQQNIFDPFFTTKDESSIGLGLSQVYGFVKQSAGEIHVSSKPGHGTQLVIYLPRYVKDEADALASGSAGLSWDLSGYETILVVDDEEALRNLAEEMLSSHGYKVLVAENGEAALDVLKSNKVDVLFSDVIMPGMDGYELASRVKADYPKIKIQLASGFSDMYHVRKFDEVLHELRLQKPYSSKMLLQKIRELLDRVEIF